MRHSAWLLSLPLLWLAAAPLPAQDQSAAPLYEEVEVLRHLLRTKISEGYAQASQVAGHGNANAQIDFGQGSVHWYNANRAFYDARLNQPTAPSTMTPYVPSNFVQEPNQQAFWGYVGVTGQPHAPDLRTEGAYIRGQGMLFTITMPPWPQLHYLKVQPTLQPPSEWEQARQQVQGEGGGIVNFEVQLKTGPNLKEVLLKVLAENGKHLKHLKDNESVTIVIVFRGGGASSRVLPITAALVWDQKPASDKPQSPKPVPSANQAERQTLLDSYFRLYELQVKQGRIEEARKAIDQLLKLLDEEGSEGQVSQKARREMLRRALQFYLTVENPTPDEVKRIRKLTDELTKEPVKPRITEIDLTEAPVAPRLPSRLIITVPKKVLIQAGSGKLDVAAFEKLVQIEEVNWKK
jgi:hypothetical protein